MPAGLDGNPDPIVTAERELVLEALVGAVANIDRAAHVASRGMAAWTHAHRCGVPPDRDGW